MIEIDIPSIDPIQHEPKIFVGMTSRQCLCIVPGLAIGFGLAMLLKNINLDFAVIGMSLGVVPAVLLGWYTPYNMKFEQYAKLWYFNTFVANSKRIYKTDNAVEEKRLTIKELQALEKQNKEKQLDEKKKAKKSQTGKER